VDSQQARQILACYRPGSDDPADPRLAEALEQARHDTELARWLEEQTALDAALRDRLREVPVPLDLRSKILAQYPRRPAVSERWRPTSWVAASLVALAVVAGLWLANRRPRFDAYRQQMAGLVSGEYEMSLKSKDLDEIRRYLASRQSPSDYVLSPAMEALEPEGGTVIEWHGRKVSLVCLEAGEEADLFLFVIGRSVLADVPVTESPQFANVRGMTTATWVAGDDVYLLAAHGDEQFLRQYL
jgi:hypothetical protein